MVASDDREPSIATRRPPPSHPPYALMIREAIRSLGEGRGSTETSISEYIRGNFEGLPWGHDRLLPYYLHKLTRDGEFVEGDGALYRIAQADDGGGGAEEEGPGSSLALSEAQLLFEKRGVHGEDDLEALNRAVPPAREAETGGGDGDQAIADIDDGDNDEATAVEPEPPTTGPLQGETKRIENVEAIANVNDGDDDEGVPIACEGDLFMEVQSLAIFLGPRNKLESPNCYGGNSELVHELSRMSLIEPQEAESEGKKNHGGEGSESKPRRRGRPPKKRRTHNSSIGSSTAIVAQDGDLGRIQNSIVMTEPICPGGDVVVEPLQAVFPHQELINVKCAENDLALVQSEPQTSMPKRRGRPPKRKLEATDSSKKVMGLDGDIEPIQVVDPSSLGTNDNVVDLLVPEKTSRNKDDGSKPVPKRRRMQPKKKNESVGTSKEVIVHGRGIEALQSVNPSSLAIDDNVKLLVYEEAIGNKGDGLHPLSKRCGRPPKRKHESTDRSKIIMPNDGDVAKRRGRPPKTKLIMAAREDTPTVVAMRVEKIDKKKSTSVSKRHGRPPKTNPDLGDK